MTHWYKSTVGQMHGGTLPLNAGEWLSKRSNLHVAEDLFWLTDAMKDLRSYALRIGVQVSLAPKIHRFTVPFEYEVVCFEEASSMGENYRYWASRTELAWPRTCEFDPLS